MGTANERRTEAREQPNALQALIEPSGVLSRVVEQIADSVILTDMQGVIHYVNPAFEATSGYSRDEAIGKTPRILKSGLHDMEFYRQMWERFAQGLPFKGMVINRKKTGELYWAQLTITAMRDGVGHLTHFVSVSQDVTELRKKQEQEFQLQLAHDVQQRFYAAAPPLVSGFDIGASTHPADETGGDYFDFIPMADGSLVIAVADAKGHGFGSALVMALTRAYVRCFAGMQLEVDEILTHVNRMLLEDLKHGDFVTLLLARLNSRQRTLSYASAGHVPGVVFLNSGDVKCTLDSTGPPLGLFPASKFPLRAISLDPGEIAVLLTDGVIESTTPDGHQFGHQRVLDQIRILSHNSAANIANGVYQAARDFVQGDLQDDDITSVIIKADHPLTSG